MSNKFTGLESFSLNGMLANKLEKWNEDKNRPFIGKLGSRIVGVVSTPFTSLIDFIAHLVLFIGKTVTGVIVTPWNSIVGRINNKLMLPADMELASAFIHLSFSINSIFKIFIMPLVMLLDPSSAHKVVNVSQRQEINKKQTPENNDDTLFLNVDEEDEEDSTVEEEPTSSAPPLPPPPPPPPSCKSKDDKLTFTAKKEKGNLNEDNSSKNKAALSTSELLDTSRKMAQQNTESDLSIEEKIERAKVEREKEKPSTPSRFNASMLPKRQESSSEEDSDDEEVWDNTNNHSALATYTGQTLIESASTLNDVDDKQTKTKDLLIGLNCLKSDFKQNTNGKIDRFKVEFGKFDELANYFEAIKINQNKKHGGDCYVTGFLTARNEAIEALDAFLDQNDEIEIKQEEQKKFKLLIDYGNWIDTLKDRF